LIPSVVERNAMRKEWALHVMLGTLTSCAIVVTALVVRREFMSSARDRRTGTVEVSDWRQYAVGGHLIGPPSAPISIVEFADFQCPYCKRLSDTFAALRASRGNDFKVIYRHYPITQIHAAAFDAAVAADCAAKQGRFEVFHDALFKKQDSIGIISWVQFARRAGVPSQRDFNRCMESPSRERAVRDDLEAGDRLQVRGTPTVLVENVRLPGTPSLRTLDSLLNVMLRRIRGR